MSDTWSIVVLSASRAPWARAMTQWATDGRLPATVLTCTTEAEASMRLTGGQRWSAIVIDGRHPGADREVLGVAAQNGALSIVVAAPNDARDWHRLGADHVVDPDLTVDHLHALLRGGATPTGGELPRPIDVVAPRPPALAPLVAVIGPGGTGTSTVASALAQGLAGDHRSVLADFALRADLAMLHDTADVLPGVQELVEAHRSGTPDRDAIVSMTFDVVNRGHRLLAGLRRTRDWTVLRRRSTLAAIDGLRSAFDVVVCDLGPDLDGDPETGSTDVEDRHLLARTSLTNAAVVAVVGRDGTKGVHSLVRLIGEITDLGVDPTILVPVINAAPRSRAARAEATRAVGRLLAADPVTSVVLSPLFVPRRDIDRVWRDGGRLPDAVVAPITDVVLAHLGDLAPVHPGADHSDEPVAVVPGTLGFADTDDGQAA